MLHSQLTGLAPSHQTTHAISQYSDARIRIDAKGVFVTHALQTRMGAANHLHADFSNGLR
jgi:hypothetical protein